MVPCLKFAGRVPSPWHSPVERNADSLLMETPWHSLATARERDIALASVNVPAKSCLLSSKHLSQPLKRLFMWDKMPCFISSVCLLCFVAPDVWQILSFSLLFAFFMRLSSRGRCLTSLSRSRLHGVAGVSLRQTEQSAFLSSSFSPSLLLSRKQSTHHLQHHDEMQSDSNNQTTSEVARINFSRAQPPTSLLPFSLLQSAVTTQSWVPVDDSFLGYGDRRGQKELLDVLANFISSFTNTKGKLF